MGRLLLETIRDPLAWLVATLVGAAVFVLFGLSPVWTVAGATVVIVPLCRVLWLSERRR